MTGRSPNVLAVVKESAVRRLGKPTLIGYLVLLVAGIIGVGASVAWMFVGTTR